jgi:hypothetical protein
LDRFADVPAALQPWRYADSLRIHRTVTGINF